MTTWMFTVHEDELDMAAFLPVVDHGKLVGIVSETDFMPIAYELLGERRGGGS